MSARWSMGSQARRAGLLSRMSRSRFTRPAAYPLPPSSGSVRSVVAAYRPISSSDRGAAQDPALARRTVERSERHLPRALGKILPACSSDCGPSSSEWSFINEVCTQLVP